MQIGKSKFILYESNLFFNIYLCIYEIILYAVEVNIYN